MGKVYNFCISNIIW